MNALNEVNKVISSVSYYTHRHGNPEEEEWLTAERMAVRAHDPEYDTCWLRYGDADVLCVFVSGMDSAEQHSVHCPERQSSSAAVCREAGEDPAIRH